MISLGSHDASVPKEALAAYQKRVQALTAATALAEWNTQLRDEGRWVGYTPLAAGEPITVTELQQFLRDAGFRPHGEVNGICGYRTVAGLFLFQEYVRTIEGQADIGFPDGRCGNTTAEHVKRWKAGGLKADWASAALNPSAEYSRWMGVLKAAQAKYAATPGDVQSKVNAAGACDTVKVADWTFDPDAVHLVGIRRRKAVGQAQNLDDLFKLLIHGQVFTFYGSTEPGTKSEDEPKFPYLVPGQHRYRLGWHKQSNADKIFQALKPQSRGVLVQRSAAKIATDAELKGPLDPRLNTSINVHWGGGGTKDEASWSAGCQVIVGNSYANHRGKVVDCSPFSAEGYAGLGTLNDRKVYLTKGAYTMLVNLIAALAKDDGDNLVVYTLLTEADGPPDDQQFAGASSRLIDDLRRA